MSNTAVTRNTISSNQRIKHTSDLFGIRFPVNIEPAIYSIAGNIAAEYDGVIGAAVTVSQARQAYCGRM